MILLPGLLFILWGNPARCRGFAFDGDIRHFAVSGSGVYIATEETLYQLSHNLSLVQSVTQRGVSRKTVSGSVHFQRVSEPARENATLRVNTLLPFVENRTLISCGAIHNESGFCEVRDLGNISNVVHWESILVGPLRPGASVSLLVSLEKSPSSRDFYILTAVQQRCEDKSETKPSSIHPNVLSLHNTLDSQSGGIFSYSDSGDYSFIDGAGDVDFVDGFQINSTIYLFSVIPGTDKVRLIWLEGKTSRVRTLSSLRGVTLSVSEDARLLASSRVPGGPPVLWSGVFGAGRGQADTELLLFDISPDLSLQPGRDPYFGRDCSDKTKNRNSIPTAKTLKHKAVIFRQKDMTSVLAVRQEAWMVFFIGTGDGQLFKIAVDRNYQTTCPTVLYMASDNRPMFSKIHLDQVDRKHVYVLFKNQMERVPLSMCSDYRNLQACWSAKDPHCVWCFSKRLCTFVDDCEDSDSLPIPDHYQQKMISHNVLKDPSGQITLIVQIHLNLDQEAVSNFACQFSRSSGELCRINGPPPQFPQCTCILSNNTLVDEGLTVTIKTRFGRRTFSEHLTLTNCSNIRGPPTSVLCQQCITSGCGWSKDHCSWANKGVRNDSVCQNMETGINYARPEISSITPSVVSFYGRNHAVLSGRNLSDVIRVRIQPEECSPHESPVWNNTGVSLTFHIFKTDRKGVVRVCALLPDGRCHGNLKVSYQSLPSCTGFVPNSTWVSGKRKVTLVGSHLDFVEGVMHSHTSKVIRLGVNSYENLTYDTPAAPKNRGTFNSTVFLKVANETLPCSRNIAYYPDPEFTSFTSTRKGGDVRIVVEKKEDHLQMTAAELSVVGIHGGKEHRCIMLIKETKNKTDFFTCDIKTTPISKFQQIMIMYGDKKITLQLNSPQYVLMLLVLLLIPFIIIIVMVIYRRKQKKFTAEMNRLMEDLELDIRNDIRKGFVDLQTEKVDLMENVGAIPFLDYKHFASRIFFPESESLMALCIRDIGQDAVKVELDESCQSLSRLIQDQLFLTSMVHAMEEQKRFTIKDKCTLASLLTVALHGNLIYLTEVMEVLLTALMQQNINTQPKMLLRCTESIVEKLLTNWMSICLYGFLRETVGQHLFLMVSALTQQITKGPVDCVTEKALYTLSEEWLLWQAPNFSCLKLKVLFVVDSDGEVSEPLEVNALSCDTIEQVKEKILSTFKAKFGFPYNIPLRDVCIEYEKNSSFVPLEEVDGSSEVIGEVTMINTLNHYKVPDGATIKVLSKKTRPPLSPQGSLKDDENFSGKYFHLIDPDVDKDQRKNPERKKLKLKEVHLTKLLSTKVAVHSFVENLFKNIWGTPHSRALHAVKYLYDFLDIQADNMKITDPDVLHIWKTNSLPLRFWVNILKNPQFVFDMEKSLHLDACLSVVAQAFMDSFSLSDNPLGKHAPTNKLLYAKDIPKFKQEVKAYYKQIREQSPVTDSEFRDFLLDESKKHESEFNEAAALRELYRFIQCYFTEIKEKLHQNGAPTELMEQLNHVKNLFDGLKSCSWN